MRDRIHGYIAAHKEEIVTTLKELIRIPSVMGEREENAPYGRECARALACIEGLYRQNGFETELDREGGYLLSYYGEGEKTLGLFAHADVVPAGNDWLFTSPFEPLEKDGCLIGRGALDDKSAVVTALYCAKMFKELAIPFHSRLILFTGSNEESGMQDIKHYVKTHTPPDFSLVADTGFPAYRGDKGVLHFTATAQTPLREIDHFAGGTAFNIILGQAEATCHGRVFTQKGISKHGALPEGSVNAGHLLAKELSQHQEICREDRQQMAFAAAALEQYYGEVFGIEHTDPVFGRLTCTNGIIATENGRLRLCFDLRYGPGADIEGIKSKIVTYFAQHDWAVAFVKQQKPFCLTEEDPYLLACLGAYRTFTGREKATAHVNAGGTYASHLPRAAEIGTVLDQSSRFPIPDGHGGAHQPDEYINTDGFLRAIELTALMLLACDETEDD